MSGRTTLQSTSFSPIRRAMSREERGWPVLPGLTTGFLLFSPSDRFVNTMSNIPFILLGVYGVLRCVQQDLPLRAALSYSGLMIVGAGSECSSCIACRELSLPVKLNLTLIDHVLLVRKVSGSMRPCTGTRR